MGYARLIFFGSMPQQDPLLTPAQKDVAVARIRFHQQILTEEHVEGYLSAMRRCFKTCEAYERALRPVLEAEHTYAVLLANRGKTDHADLVEKLRVRREASIVKGFGSGGNGKSTEKTDPAIVRQPEFALGLAAR